MQQQGDFDQIRLLNRVVTAHYSEDKSQVQIAEEIGLSTAKVNRLLKQARESGMIEITVRTAFQHVFELEEQLRAHFELRDPVVIPRVSDAPDSVLSSVGAAAAKRLLDSVRDGDTICISGGKAIHEVVSSIEPIRAYDVEVVPATGGVQGHHYTDVNYLAAQLATRLGGEVRQLHAPIFVESPKEREALLSVRQISEVLDHAKRADIALVGIGAVDSITASYFDLTQLSGDDRSEFVQKYRGCGELFAHIYDETGNPCADDHNARLVGLCPEDLKNCPISIGVAANSEKERPIRGALRGGYLSTLVTDERTARAVLNDDKGAK